MLVHELSPVVHQPDARPALLQQQDTAHHLVVLAPVRLLGACIVQQAAAAVELVAVAQPEGDDTLRPQVTEEAVPFCRRLHGAACIGVYQDVALLHPAQACLQKAGFPVPVSSPTGMTHERMPLHIVGQVRRSVRPDVVEDAERTGFRCEPLCGTGVVLVAVGDEILHAGHFAFPPFMAACSLSSSSRICSEFHCTLWGVRAALRWTGAMPAALERERKL